LVPNSPYFVRLLVGLTADGRWLQFSQSADKLWEAFVDALGLAWTRDDPALHDGPASDDPAVRVRFWELALAAVRSKTHAEWLASFDEHPDVWAEVFRSGDELLDHPQLVHDGRVLEQHGVRQPGALADLSATPAWFDRPPELDEHGDDARADASTLVTAPLPAPPPVLTGAATPPLDGITVIELGTWFAGPFGATRLAELGARVIKIEPLTGDPIRHAIPFPELAGVKVTAGKESVAVDLGTDAGRAVALALVERADLVLQSYRAGVAERLGLGRADMLAVNADLVLVEAPGYGSGGPCGHRPAFAPTMGAGSGLAYRSLGGRGAVPDGPDLTLDQVKRSAIRLSMAAMSVANADGFSALGVATASLLGLLARRRHGIGQVVTTSMLSTMAHALADSLVAAPGADPAPVPDAGLHGFGPRWRLYEAADGWVFLAAPHDGDVAPLAKCLGVDEGDLGHADRLAVAFRTRPAAEWERDLLAADVACVEVAPVGIDQTGLLGDLGRRLGIVVDAHHQVLEDHPRLGPLVSMSRSTSVLGPSPLCGDDTERVLAELGYGPEQVTNLRAQGVMT
jgi:crotonobetainyl-CoA:carnitine CoA-transferase CaiB-like acyl-CoA transferase